MAKYQDTQTGIVSEIGSPELNPSLVSGKTLVSDTTPLGNQPNYQSITSSNLANNGQIKLPTQQPDNTNYAGIIAGGNASIDSLNKNTYTTPSGAVVDFMGNIVKEAPKADPLTNYANTQVKTPDVNAIYNSVYNNSNYNSLQTDANTKALATKQAQDRLRTINAQLSGINAEAQTIPIQLQKDATGRGITAGGLQPLQTAQLRDNALKALPLQAQAIAAQAEVASAQGDQELANNLLTQAQTHLDRVFQIQVSDATNQYNYQKDLRDKVYEYATSKEKTQLDKLNKEDDRNFQLMKDGINNAQALAKTAIENGQSGLASQIANLDPKSPTFTQDLARLQGQIRVVQKANEKPPTAAQEVVATYAARLEQSNPILNSISPSILKMNPATFALQMALPSFLQNSAVQSYSQAAKNFINATLRRESGAVIADSEFKNAQQQYLPVPGDTPEVLAQKEANRKLVQQSFKQASGSAYSSVNDLIGIQPNSADTNYLKSLGL